MRCCLVRLFGMQQVCVYYWNCWCHNIRMHLLVRRGENMPSNLWLPFFFYFIEFSIIYKIYLVFKFSLFFKGFAWNDENNIVFCFFFALFFCTNEKKWKSIGIFIIGVCFGVMEIHFLERLSQNHRNLIFRYFVECFAYTCNHCKC